MSYQPATQTLYKLLKKLQVSRKAGKITELNIPMKKQTKRRIKYGIAIVLGSLILGISLIVYNVLGPFRSFFWNAPYMMGLFGPKTYLVLLQNNNELRPTGGFITAVAEVNTLFGYPSINVNDSYSIPNPPQKLPAPNAFEYLIGQNDPFFAGWTIRDANFSPDFSQSAKDVINLYNQAYPEKYINGVFSIDFAVIEKLLELYGPIQVEDVTFDQENFFINSQRISKDIDTHDVEQLKNRKNILKPFANALTKEIIGTPSLYSTLFNELFELSQRKHILAYTSAEGLQKKFGDYYLTGSMDLPEANSDYLHVNIANIGGRKADRYMTKQISYRADFSNPEQHASKVEINLEHLGSYNIQSDIYQAYIRVYVPEGSKLLGASGNTLTITEQTNELGFTVYADYIRMKPGDQLTLTYTYQLPETILPNDYRLKVIKQAGVDDQYWHIAVKQMNDTMMKNGNTGTPMIVRENLASWQGTLNIDQEFHVSQSADTQGPIVLWQKFETIGRINVRFNELIDTTTALDRQNYSITDKNEKNDVSDTVSITSVKFEDRDLWITVDGITDQPEEHYQLVLKNIQDVHGNMTNPNPLTRTLVQRFE
jgi:hypothetical protein